MWSRITTEFRVSETSVVHCMLHVFRSKIPNPRKPNPNKQTNKPNPKSRAESQEEGPKMASLRRMLDRLRALLYVSVSPFAHSALSLPLSLSLSLSRYPSLFLSLSLSSLSLSRAFAK